MVSKALTWIIAIAVIIVVAWFVVLNYGGIFGRIGGTYPCAWVFKTDPSNIGRMDGVIDKVGDIFSSESKMVVGRTSLSPHEIIDLNNDGYFSMTAACRASPPYPAPKGFVFFKAKTNEEFNSYHITGENVSPEQITAAVKDANPLGDLHYCGEINKKHLTTEELQEIISNGELDSKCRKAT